MVPESEHALAIREALADALGKWSAYDYDDVPDDLPSLYAVIGVSRRYGAPVYMSGASPMNGWRLTTLAVGRTVDEARWVRARVEETIKDQPLFIAGFESTFVRFETETEIEPDDGRYSGRTSWTYAL